MNSSLLSLIVVCSASVAVVACHKAEDTAPDAGLAAAGNDADRWEEPDMRFHQSLLSATHNELMEPLGALIETALAMGFRLSNATPGGPNKLEQEIGN